jgi:hypothetical protein
LVILGGYLTILSHSQDYRKSYIDSKQIVDSIFQGEYWLGELNFSMKRKLGREIMLKLEKELTLISCIGCGQKIIITNEFIKLPNS